MRSLQRASRQGTSTRLQPRRVEQVIRIDGDGCKTKAVHGEGGLTGDDDVPDRHAWSGFTVWAVVAVVDSKNFFTNCGQVIGCVAADIAVGEAITGLIRPAEAGVEVMQDAVVDGVA